MTIQTVIRSTFEAYPESIQKTLLDQGFVVVEDPAVEPAAKPAFPAKGASTVGDLLAEEASDEDDDGKSGLWINIDLEHAKTHKRVAGTSLDFALFRSKEDREAGREDAFIRSLINTIEKHGVQKCNEEMSFTVTITKQGVSSVSADTDLLAVKPA